MVASDGSANTVASSRPSRMIVAKRPEKLQGLLNAIQDNPGTDIHFVSRGDWNLHDFFNSVLPWYQPADLYLTTYAIYEFPIRQILLARQANELSSVHMVLDARCKARMVETFVLAQMMSNRIGVTPCHAKIFVLKGPNGCITKVGSQNWTNNPRIEAGVVSTNPAVANFYIDFINNILDHAHPFE
jgi:hypothetical protein